MSVNNLANKPEGRGAFNCNNLALSAPTLVSGSSRNAETVSDTVRPCEGSSCGAERNSAVCGMDTWSVKGGCLYFFRSYI